MDNAASLSTAAPAEVEGVRQMVTTASGLTLFPPVTMQSTAASQPTIAMTSAGGGITTDTSAANPEAIPAAEEMHVDDDHLSVEARSDIMSEVLDTNLDPAKDAEKPDSEDKGKEGEVVMMKCDFCDLEMPKKEFHAHIRSSKHRRNKNKRKKQTASENTGIEMKHDPEWQKKIEDSTEPLIGLQYVSELVRDEPELKHRFWCQICRTKDVQLIQHVVSRNHRMTYIKKFYDQYAKEIQMMEPKNAKAAKMTEVAAKIVKEEGGIGTMKLEMDSSVIALMNKYDAGGEDPSPPPSGGKRPRNDSGTQHRQGQGQSGNSMNQNFNNPTWTIQTSGSSFLLREMQYTIELLNRDSIRSEEESRVALLLSNQLLTALCNFKNIQDNSMYGRNYSGVANSNFAPNFNPMGGMSSNTGNSFNATSSNSAQNDLSGNANPAKKRRNRRKRGKGASNLEVTLNNEDSPMMGHFYERLNDDYLQ